MIKFIWALGLTIVSSTALPFAALAQLHENFDDGDFTLNPGWQGDVSDFTVESGRLWLQAPPESGRSGLATPSKIASDASWEFLLGMAFNPSDANHARIYLMSDQHDLTGPVEGYFVMAGGRNDEVSLYRQDGSNVTRIIDGADGYTDMPEVNLRVKVTRDSGGRWKLYAGAPDGGDPIVMGEATDPAYATSSYFGVSCTYTSTRSAGFYFDEITVTGIAGPDVGYEPAYKGLIITEIFPDPSPAVALPEAEFVEIYNRTSESCFLGGFTLSDGSATGTFPEIVLAPGAYVIATSPAGRDLFNTTAHVAALHGMPALNNGGDAIVIRSRTGVVIDSVNYSSAWYGDPEKAAGGWTLELIDPENTCGEEHNWTASTDPSGGTPGRQNAVFASMPDHAGPRVTEVIAADRSRVRIYFDEKLADEPVETQDIIFDPPVGVAGVFFSDRSLRTLEVALSETLETRTLYSVTVRRIRDCSGNMISAAADAWQFAVTEEADSLDVVINEVLFNPAPGGADFVELFNRSPKYINLNGWAIGNYADGGPVGARAVSHSDLLLKPGAYLVLTSSPDALMNHYPRTPSESVVQVTLPSMPDDAGSAAMIDPSGNVIDVLAYSSDWHSVFLAGGDGVSLERISPDAATSDPHNWSSASSGAGYGTPGMENSNARKTMTLPADAVMVDPPVFRPGSVQTGFTLIRYRLAQPGCVANARILDARGRTVKLLASNDLLGTEGFYTWEGDCDDGSRARVGYYCLWFEVFSPSGRVVAIRDRIIIAGDF